MLHIILTILKIIGIILAALLGILLVAVLLVLFVPIGYSAQAENRGGILVKARAWWLFHALHISFDMEGMPSAEEGRSPVIKVRILGIPIIDTSRKKEETKKGVFEEDGKTQNDNSVTKEKDIGLPELTTQEVLSERKEDTKAEDAKAFVSKEEKVQDVQKVQAVKKSETEQVKSEKTASEQTVNKKLKKKQKKSKQAKSQLVKEKPVSGSEKKKVKIADIFEKIRNVKEDIRIKIANIRQTIANLLGKVELIKAFLQDETNKQGIGKIFASIKGILKHMLPRKIKGNVLFGLNDPCATGQALGVLGVLYPYYGKSLSIQPDFTRQVIEGDIYIKGYIQIFTLCFIAIKLMINANFRKLIKNFMKLKEEI